MKLGNSSIRRKIGLLAFTAAVYLAVAFFTTPGFFDGFAPLEPYRWVSPPPGVQSSNQPPLPGRGSFGVRSDGVVNAGSVATQDGQAQLSFEADVFSRPAGSTTVTVDIRPVAQFPAHASFVAVSNVYEITASTRLTGAAQIALRYPDTGPAPAHIYAADSASGRWASVGGSAAPPYEVAQTRVLGYFAAGYPVGTRPPQDTAGKTSQLVTILVPPAVFLLVFGIPLLVLWLMVRRRR